MAATGSFGWLDFDIDGIFFLFFFLPLPLCWLTQAYYFHLNSRCQQFTPSFLSAREPQPPTVTAPPPSSSHPHPFLAPFLKAAVNPISAYPLS